MKSTENRTRPKVMNGIVGLLEASRRGNRTAQLWRFRQRFSTTGLGRLGGNRACKSKPSCEQARLLLARTLLGLDGGDRRHVQDAAGGHRRRQAVGGARRPD